MKIVPQLSRKLAVAGLLALAACGTLWAASNAFAAKGGPTVVLFNANWCASCRDVIPIVKEIAGQNNLTVLEIDVDQQDAPGIAKGFGLSVPASAPPQVFYVNKGQATLIFDGASYKYGHADTIRSSVLGKLQPILGK